MELPDPYMDQLGEEAPHTNRPSMGRPPISESTLLRSTPIRSVRIDLFDPSYIVQVRWYLEHDLGCTLAYMSGGFYNLTFPEGPVEEVHAGRSTPNNYETTIRLPNGVTLLKLVRTPINRLGSTQTEIGLPRGAFDHKA